MTSGSADDSEEREIAGFDDALVKRQPRLLVVPALAAVNTLVMLAFCLSEGGWIHADAVRLIAWGSNYGPMTLDGQPWRLLTGTFLHAGFPHLIINLMSFWVFGRMAERLYGPTVFAVLYLLGALGGSAFSLMWDPYINSVGASGAVMGVIGATLMFMVDGARKVPFSVLKEHAAVLVSFAAYSLLAVWSDAPVDHAAHIGGFIAGGVAGGAAGAFSGPRSNLKAALGLSACALAIAFLAGAGRLRLENESSMNFISALNGFEFSERDANRRLDAALKAPQDRQAGDEFQRLAESYGNDHERFALMVLPAASPWREMRGLLADYTAARGNAMQVLALDPQAQEEYRRHIDAARPIFERIAAQPAWQRAAAINAGASTYSQGGITPR